MMLSFIALIGRFWQLLAGGVAGALVSYFIMSIVYSYTIDDLKGQIVQAQLDERKACNERIKISESVTYEVQNKLNSITKRNASLVKRLQHEATNNLRFASNTSADNAGTGTNGFSCEAGSVALELIDMATAADRQTAQLQACQKFVKDVWRANQ